MRKFEIKTANDIYCVEYHVTAPSEAEARKDIEEFLKGEEIEKLMQEEYDMAQMNDDEKNPTDSLDFEYKIFDVEELEEPAETRGFRQVKAYRNG